MKECKQMRKKIENKGMNEKEVKELRESGVLWYINIIIHAFGWCLFQTEIIDKDGDPIKVLLPARTKFRGFSQHSNDNGYRKLAEYLVKNADTIYEDAIWKDDDDDEKYN